MIPHDDHVRLYRLRKNPALITRAQSDAIIKQSAYRWGRLKWRKEHPNRSVQPQTIDALATFLRQRKTGNYGKA
jgi:hypothetical protein